MGTRTDIHRPGAIIPGQYKCVFSYNLSTTMDGWPIPSLGVNCELDYRREERDAKGNLVQVINGKHQEDGRCCIVQMLATGKKFVKTGGTGQCSVCSTHFIYGDVWEHEPTGEFIHVGHQCAHKYGLMTDRSAWEMEFGRLKAAAAVQIKKAQTAEIRKTFCAKHEGLEEALNQDHPILKDMSAKLSKYSSLSDKQVAFALSLAKKVMNPPAPPPAEDYTPAPVGRVTFQGEVMSKKAYDGKYGTTFKMTVKVVDSSGKVWLAWGTCPDSLLCLANEGQPLSRGDVVEVTATLSPGRDPHFAMMKRPVAKRLQVNSQLEPIAF